MITCYISIPTCLRVYYLEGVFYCMEMDKEDKILFDVFRHNVEIYEAHLDEKKFRKIAWNINLESFSLMSNIFKAKS